MSAIGNDDGIKFATVRIDIFEAGLSLRAIIVSCNIEIPLSSLEIHLRAWTSSLLDSFLLVGARVASAINRPYELEIPTYQPVDKGVFDNFDYPISAKPRMI